MNKIAKEGGKAIVKIAKSMSVVSANTTCLFAAYQEKMPKDLKKLRKF